MYDLSVTRLPAGQNNTRDTELFSDHPVDDWTKNHNFYNDFDDYFGPAAPGSSNGYTLSGAGATAALLASDGGVVQITAAASTPTSLQKQGHFSIVKGLRLWVRQLIAVDSVLGLVLSGITNVTATPFTGGSITDGVWFSSTSAGVLSINVAVGSVVTTVACGNSLVGGNYASLGWYWDASIYAPHQPNGAIVWEAAQPPSGASGVTSNQRGSIVAPANFPGATLLAFLSGVSPSTAVARTLNIDYWYALKDRINILATPPF